MNCRVTAYVCLDEVISNLVSYLLFIIFIIMRSSDSHSVAKLNYYEKIEL